MTANLVIGGRALALEYNPFNDSIYVTYTNDEKGFVSAIDSSTNIVYATVEVGGAPVAIEYNPSNHDLYVANSGSGSVSVLDSSTNTVITTLNVGHGPRSIEYNPSNENIYVANRGSNNVAVLDSSTNTIVDTVDVGGHPYIIKYNPNNEYLYVANGDLGDKATNESVAVIDGSTNEVISMIENSSSRPSDIEFNPTNNQVYISNPGSNTVTIIDGQSNTILDIINLKNPPTALQYNPKNNDIYVAVAKQTPGFEAGLFENGFIAIIDGSTNNVEAVQAVGFGPTDLEYNPTNYNIYVSNIASSDVYVIDSTSNNGISLIPVGVGPLALKYNPSNNDIYVATWSNIARSEGQEQTILSVISPSPLIMSHSPDDNVQKVIDFLKDLVENPINSNISVQSLDEAINLLSDSNPKNDQSVCDVLDTLIKSSDMDKSNKIITPSSTAKIDASLDC